MILIVIPFPGGACQRAVRAVGAPLLDATMRLKQRPAIRPWRLKGHRDPGQPGQSALVGAAAIPFGLVRRGVRRGAGIGLRWPSGKGFT
jgi:hypothetical protein